VGKSDKIRVFIGSRAGDLVVLHRVTGRLIELLQLRQDFRAELKVVMADQAYAALNAANEELRRSPRPQAQVSEGESNETVESVALAGAAAIQRLIADRDSVSQIFDHCNNLLLLHQWRKKKRQFRYRGRAC
jgi:hypothetical protein